MSEPARVEHSSLPYKKKLIPKGFVEMCQLPSTRGDPDWNLLLNHVLPAPELIQLKNTLFSKKEGKTTIIARCLWGAMFCVTHLSINVCQ
jgi:hypothetical protein